MAYAISIQRLGIDMATQAPAAKPTGRNLGELAGREPAQQIKGYIRNLILYDDLEQKEFNDTLEFWYRPSNVRESGSANYKQIEVLGMSHKYRTFSSTNNFKFRFDLYFNSLMRLKQHTTQLAERGRGEGGYSNMIILADEMEEHRRFIEALLIPYQTPAGEMGAENPPCILVIPGIVGIKCKLDNFNFEFRDCIMDGGLKELMCQVEFSEEPEQRVTMRDHLATGMERTWGD